MQALKEMMGDLNDLLAKKARGEDTPEDFAEFMAKHGDTLGEEGVENLDDLVDALARRAAAASRLMRSLSPQQRDELSSLMQQALGSDLDLQAQMAQLNDNLRALRPDLDFARGERVRGQGEPLGYGEAADALQDISELDDLLDQLGQEHPGATLDDVDVDALERQLGRGAADELQRLRDLERELQRQGWLSRSADGLTLSPKALRRLGQTALREVLGRLDTGAAATTRTPTRAPAANPRGRRGAGSSATSSRSTSSAPSPTRCSAGLRPARGAPSGCPGRTSRSSRPNGARERPSRCASTCRSPWPRRAAGDR